MIIEQSWGSLAVRCVGICVKLPVLFVTAVTLFSAEALKTMEVSDKLSVPAALFKVIL